MQDHIAAKARIAGLLYILVIAAGFFAEYYVRGLVMAPGDAAETAARLQAHEQLFRIGLVGEIFAGAFYAAIVMLLHEIIAPADRSLSRLAAVFGVVGSTVFIVNLLNKLAALVILNAAQADAASIFAALRLHTSGYQLAMIFFGFYLFVAGWVMLRASYVPRFLAILWFVGGVGYVVVFVAGFVAEGVLGPFARAIRAPGNIGEIVMALWLLCFTAKATEKRRAQLQAPQ
jgi:hypothetical protein